MEQNKTSKYFKYAIGEIILVVIGILIALQINNWNENRKNNIVEQETLLNLKSDMESALIQLNAKLKQNKNYRYIDSLLLDCIYQKKDIPADSLHMLTLSHIWSPGFDPELGTLNEILSTGKMNVLKNRKLRKHISTWNKYIDELEETDTFLAHFDLNVKSPLYSKYLPYKNMLRQFSRGKEGQFIFPKSNLDWNSKALLQNKEFENMLSSYIVFSDIQYQRLSDIKNNIKEMISLINQDVKK